MPRRPLAIGTSGEISCWEEPRKGKPSYRAQARFRGADGITRAVIRYGQTKARARDNVRAALAELVAAVRTSGVITADTRVDDLADVWLAAPQGWSVNTRETYGYVIENQVKPSLGGVRLRELRPARVGAAIATIRDASGPGSAKTAKTVLAGMFDYAVTQDAMQANPARVKVHLGRVVKSPRALTVAEVETISDTLRTVQRHVDLDIPDLVDWMLGTGMRIGEACAVRAGALKAATVEVNATVVRVKGVGLVVQERPKTAAGWRRLALPSYLTDMLERRASEKRPYPSTAVFLQEDGEYRTDTEPGIVLVSPNGKIRDPSNTAGDLRAALDEIGFEWVTFHTFRKTVATRMDEAGMSAREIADQLGHAKPSLTQDVYMGRRVVSAEAARVLDR